MKRAAFTDVMKMLINKPQGLLNLENVKLQIMRDSTSNFILDVYIELFFTKRMLDFFKTIDICNSSKRLFQ